MTNGRKIWRWEVIGGLCLMHGWRYGAEIGVAEGRFTIALCHYMRDMRMIAVDLWAPFPDRAGENAETYVGWQLEERLAVFRKQIGRQQPCRVRVLREDTVAAAARIRDGALDFVFIDADHSYAGCRADIEAWQPKVRPGGLVAGHDHNLETVARAVADTGGRHEVASDNVWLRHVA